MLRRQKKRQEHRRSTSTSSHFRLSSSSYHRDKMLCFFVGPLRRIGGGGRGRRKIPPLSSSRPLILQLLFASVYGMASVVLVALTLYFVLLQHHQHPLSSSYNHNGTMMRYVNRMDNNTKKVRRMTTRGVRWSDAGSFYKEVQKNHHQQYPSPLHREQHKRKQFLCKKENNINAVTRRSQKEIIGEDIMRRTSMKSSFSAAETNNHTKNDGSASTDRRSIIMPTEEYKSISACLLTMDDNHFLIEWLAYHYHVLPLRDLIVAVDPRAKTSPQEVFDRWKGLINITVWNDTHIFGEDEMINHDININNETGNPLVRLHRRRQLIMYEKCMQKFKSDGHQWVILLDTDEFMVVKANDHGDIRWPGSVLKYLKGHANKGSTDNNSNVTSSACLPLPRRRYGRKESLSRFLNKHVPKGFNSSNFLTLRWRHYGMQGKNSLIKSMIDVSRVDWDDLHTKPEKKYNVHAPLEICGKRVEMSLNESDLIVSHYPGTWEQFSFREDARIGSNAENMKSEMAYHKLLRFQAYRDDLHRDWLIGFVKAVGDKEAHRLLKDVGKVKAGNK